MLKKIRDKFLLSQYYYYYFFFFQKDAENINANVKYNVSYFSHSESLDSQNTSVNKSHGRNYERLDGAIYQS